MEQFAYSFQLSKIHIFFVSYKSIGAQAPYFATSGSVLNRPKTDYNMAGQCQDELNQFTEAYNFYKKWDLLHCHPLSQSEYNEVCEDLKQLKEVYNWIPSQGFYDVRTLSKQKVKQYNK